MSAHKQSKGLREPARFNVFEPDRMMVHDGGRCEYTAARADELAAAAPGRSVTPASGQAAQVDAAIRREVARAAQPGEAPSRVTESLLADQVRGATWADDIMSALHAARPEDRAELLNLRGLVMLRKVALQCDVPCAAALNTKRAAIEAITAHF